jgi:hypothetical protein
MKNWEQEKSRVGDLLKKSSEKGTSKTKEKGLQETTFKTTVSDTYTFPQKDEGNILPVQKPEMPPYVMSEELPRVDPDKVPGAVTEKSKKWESSFDNIKMPDFEYKKPSPAKETGVITEKRPDIDFSKNTGVITEKPEPLNIVEMISRKRGQNR